MSILFPKCDTDIGVVCRQCLKVVSQIGVPGSVVGNAQLPVRVGLCLDRFDGLSQQVQWRPIDRHDHREQHIGPRCLRLGSCGWVAGAEAALPGGVVIAVVLARARARVEFVCVDSAEVGPTVGTKLPPPFAQLRVPTPATGDLTWQQAPAMTQAQSQHDGAADEDGGSPEGGMADGVELLACLFQFHLQICNLLAQARSFSRRHRVG